MIPQNIKSEIDKYKSRIPTDDELTKLFDLVNSAKLKDAQQVEVWDYFEQVQEEAKSKLKAKEQDVLDKQKKKEQEARERRIQQAKLEAKKREVKAERFLTLIGVGLSLIPFIGMLLTKESESGSHLIIISVFGLMIALISAYELKDSKKVAFRVLLVALLYFILCLVGFFTLDSNDTESTSNSDNVKIENFDANMIQEQLTEKFGQEYDFTVKDIEHMYYKYSDEEEWPIISQIIVKNIETQDKDSCYLAITPDGKIEEIGLYSTSYSDISSAIRDIIEEIKTQKE